jgi:hypothetical protein
MTKMKGRLLVMTKMLEGLPVMTRMEERLVVMTKPKDALLGMSVLREEWLRHLVRDHSARSARDAARTSSPARGSCIPALPPEC